MRLRVSGLPEDTGDERALRPAAVEALATRALERFAHSVTDAELRFGDEHGPGGGDVTCRTKATLRTGEVLRCSATAEHAETAARCSLQRMRRLLARRAERRVTTRTRRLARAI